MGLHCIHVRRDSVLFPIKMFSSASLDHLKKKELNIRKRLPYANLEKYEEHTQSLLADFETLSKQEIKTQV